jgi:multiple sugar transport system permease protein
MARREGPGRLARREELAAYLFLAPWLVGLVFLLLIPLAWATWISVTDEERFIVGRFVGLDNYIHAFTDDPYFWQSVSVTLKWIVFTTPLFLIAGLMLALLLNQRYRGMNLFRTILYIPAVLSGVAVTILWFTLLNGDNGAVNMLLRAVGVADPPFWFQDDDWAMPALALVGLWGIGGGAIIFLAGLQNIPPHLYEAAAIDGAGPLAKFRYITLPMLSPTIFFLVVNGIVDALLIFGPVFVISQGGTTGGPNDSLLFYMYYLWRKGFVEGELGYAAALAWILTIAGFILVWITFRFEKRFVYYEAGA